MKRLLLAIMLTAAATIAGGPANAEMPVFAAQCPDNHTVDADRHGKVHIDGKKANVIKFNENAYEAKDHGVKIDFGTDPGGGNLVVTYTGKNGANGICQVTAQGGGQQGSSGAASSGGAPSTDEQACLQAVSIKTNNGDVTVLSTETSEANNLVMIGVGPNGAPWRCLVKNGVVAEVMSINN